MLDKEDLQAISGIVTTQIDRAFEKNNPILLEEVDKRIHKAIEGNNGVIKGAIAMAIEENNHKIIHAIGEMLEDNVFPQFAEIHSELRKLKIVAGWQT